MDFQQGDAGFGFENLFQHMALIGLRIMTLPGIDEIVRLDQNLIVRPFDGFQGVMVADQIGDAADKGRENPESFRNSFAKNGSLLFPGIFVCVPYFSRQRGQAMSCTTAATSRMSCVSLSKVFTFADDLRISVYLHEMVDIVQIAVRKIDHFPYDFRNGHKLRTRPFRMKSDFASLLYACPLCLSSAFILIGGETSHGAPSKGLETDCAAIHAATSYRLRLSQKELAIWALCLLRAGANPPNLYVLCPPANFISLHWMSF